MYKSFYGFRDNPFQLAPDPVYLYMSRKHEEALTVLEYGLIQQSGFLLLTGEIGSGKTILVRHFLKEFCRELTTAVVTNTNMTADQLLSLVLLKFGIPPKKSAKSIQIETLHRFLAHQSASGAPALLVIDEAQNLSGTSLEELRMLSNLETDGGMLLQIFLVGQPDLKKRLKHRRLEQLAQRIAVSYHIERLTLDETAAYIAYRLEKAGGPSDLFTRRAILAVYKLSRGIPRMINLLCDASLVHGFSEDHQRIDLSHVKKAALDKGGLGIRFDDTPATPASTDRPAFGDNIPARIQAMEDTLKRLVRWAVRMQKERKKH